MEASEATESTEAQAPETDPTTDAPQEAEATESTEQTEAAPPQLNDAIQALQAQQAEILREVRGEEAPPDDLVGAFAQREPEYEEEPEGEQQGVDPQQQLSEEESLLNEIIDQRVQDFMGPIFERQELGRRTEGIRALPEKYPELKEPKVANAVANMANAHMTRLGFPAGTIPPAEVVETLYKAYAADLRNTAETPAEAGGQGATLEAGAGPSAPTSEVDPVQEQYEKAIASAVGEDPLTS